MDVILTAGGTPLPDEPLYEYTRGGPKALLDVDGKPMIQWVLDNLAGCPKIETIALIGLPPEFRLECGRPILYVDDQGNMIDNIIAGAQAIHQQNPASQHCLLAASDVPCVTTEMISWLVELVESGASDLYYLVVTREVMERTFPESRRTYVHLKGLDICGGDVNAIVTATALDPNPLWRELIANRKNPLKQASILGFDVLLGVALGWMSLERAVALVSRRLGLRGRAVICPYAEMAMDVDKPYQLELVRSHLARQAE